MSDVSGIPYMGPMGQGNFFAPPFSYNPQMTAGQISAPYAPEIANNQNVLSQLYGSGANQGFGQATANYAALGAAYGRAVPMSPGAMYMFSDTGQSAQAPAFNRGAIDNFMTGGGGFNFPSIPNYSGGVGGSYGLGEGLGSSGFNTTAMQNLFGNWNAPQQSLDWSSLFRGGGARADPYPGMAMPGGLGSPMVTPQQQPADFGSLFGRGAGGLGGAPITPQPSAPSPPEGGLASLGGLGGAPYTPAPGGLDWTKLFGGDNAPQSPVTDPYPGMAMPGGLNAPMSTQQQQPVDFGSLFGQGVGGTSQPWPADSYNPANDRPSDPAMDRPLPGNPYTDPLPGGGLTAAELGEQAKARLAELMAPKAPSPAEIFAGDKPVATEGQPVVPGEVTGEAGRGGMVGRPADPYDKLTEAIPLPRERPAAADASPATKVYPGENPPRPPTNVPVTVEPGKEASARGIQPRLRTAVEGGAQLLPPGYSVEIFSGERFDSPGHKQAYHRGGNAMDVRIIGPDGPIPDRGPDNTGMYTLLARGVKTWAAQNDPALLQQGKGGAGWGGAFETSGGSGTGDLMHIDLGGSRGNLNPQSRFGTLQPLSEAEKNAMPAYIPLLGANQVPLDGRVPTGTGSAYSAYPTRFGGGFGENGEFSGQLPSPGAFTPYPGWRQSSDFEYQEQLGRDQLARLRTGDYELPEVASTPIGMELGLGNLPTPSNVVGPRASAFELDPTGFGEGRYGGAFTPQTTAPDLSEYGPGLGSPGWSPDMSQLGQFGGSNYQYPYVGETTNLPANLATQRAMGDPFNPENYNTLDQAYDLAAKRAPFAQELLSRPDLMQKAKAVSAAEIGPNLNKRTDADIAGFFETMLNNMATGARAADFPTLESYLGKKGYYQPIRRDEPSMAAGYQTLENDPALSARLDRIFQEVVKGSNVSNLSTQNSVNIKGFPEGGEGALLPRYGGVMGQFVPGPGEYFTSMLNPYNDPRATGHIGAGAQQKYREFYRSLMPPGQMPWETR